MSINELFALNLITIFFFVCREPPSIQINCCNVSYDDEMFDKI